MILESKYWQERLAGVDRVHSLDFFDSLKYLCVIFFVEYHGILWYHQEKCGWKMGRNEKMKKVIAILMAMALMLSMVACGGGSGTSQMTKEEMLAAVEDIDFDEISTEFSKNEQRARELIQTHIGSIIEYSDFVESVGNDSAMIGHSIVYLQEEDLLKLNKNEKITVVGIVDDISYTGSGYTVTTTGTTTVQAPILDLAITLKNAYIVDKTYEVTGELDMGYLPLNNNGKTEDRTGNPEAWFCTITTDDGVVYHLEEDVPSEHELGEASYYSITGDRNNMFADYKNITIELSGEVLKRGDTITVACKTMGTRDDHAAGATADMDIKGVTLVSVN